MPIYDLRGEDLPEAIIQPAATVPAPAVGSGPAASDTAQALDDVLLSLDRARAGTRALALLPAMEVPGIVQRDAAADLRKVAVVQKFTANIARGKAELETLTKALTLPLPLLLGLAAALMGRKEALTYEAASLPLDIAQVLVTVGVVFALLQCARLVRSLHIGFVASKGHADYRDMLESNPASVNPFASYLKDLAGTTAAPGGPAQAMPKVWMTSVVPLVSCALILGITGAFPLALEVRAMSLEIAKAGAAAWMAKLSVWGVLQVGLALLVAIAAVSVCWTMCNLLHQLSCKRKRCFLGNLLVATVLGICLALVVQLRREATPGATAPKVAFECIFDSSAPPACTPKPPATAVRPAP